MVSLGDYDLLYSGDVSPADPAADDSVQKEQSHIRLRKKPLGEQAPRQYIFSARPCDLDEEPLISTLRRAETLPDLVQALLGKNVVSSPLVGPILAVTLLSLLIGNLIATSRWLWLVSLCTAGLASATWEVRSWFLAVVGASILVFGFTIFTGSINLKWFLTEAVFVLMSLFILALYTQVMTEDSRGYVLLNTGPGEEVVIQNDCCMDVKLLVFDASDIVRLIPSGGLLGGVVVQRGARHVLGSQQRYFVKVYAPFERELGSFEVCPGNYSLRATVPALVISDGGPPAFLNNTEEYLTICTYPLTCWTCSLWLPFPSLIARVAQKTMWDVGPQETVDLKGPCMLRVYRGGRLGFLSQLAFGVLHQGESAEFLGNVRWTVPPSTVRKSCSGLFTPFH